jgi:hypothetical protein
MTDRDRRWCVCVRVCTQEKILEHYWGEHIHLGYYSDEVQKEVGEPPCLASAVAARQRGGCSTGRLKQQLHYAW